MSLHAPARHSPPHFEFELFGLQATPLTASALVQAPAASQVWLHCSVPQRYPARFGIERVVRGTHRSLPDGLSVSGTHMPWHSVSAPPSSGSHAR